MTDYQGKQSYHYEWKRLGILSGQNIIIIKQTNLKYYAQVVSCHCGGVISGAFTIAHTWHVPRGLSYFYI